MGYRSEVALVMPYGDWLELKFQARQILKDNDKCPYETSIFEDVEETKFENQEAHCDWVLLRWDSVKWYTQYPDVALVQDHVDNCRGPHEFIRVGEDDDDIERHCSSQWMEFLSTRTEVVAFI